MTPIRWTMLMTVVLVAAAGCVGTSRAPFAALGANPVSASTSLARPNAAATPTDAAAPEVCKDGCCKSGSSETSPTDNFVGEAATETESPQVPIFSDPPRSPASFGT